MGSSNGEVQDLTNRLIDRTTVYGVEVSTEKSKIMTNSTINISADNQHERPEVREGAQFEDLRAHVQKWHLLSQKSSIVTYCLSKGSKGKTKQKLAL